MAQRNKIPGSFEIWRQMEGSGPTFIVALHNTRDVENVLMLLMWASVWPRWTTSSARARWVSASLHAPRPSADWARKAKMKENKGGGFTAYTRKRIGKKMEMAPEYHYWFETVMDEDHPDLDDAILTRIAEAMIMGGLEGRARREAIAAGIEFEDGEDAS